MVHNTVCRNNHVRNYLFADQNSKHTAAQWCQQCVKEIFGCYGKFGVPQCFHRTNLSSSFFHHSCHSRQTDKSRYQKENQRENLPKISDFIRIVTIVGILRKVISVTYDPFRHLKIVKLFLRLLDFPFSVCNFLLGLFFTVFVLLPSVFQFLLSVLKLFFRIRKLLLVFLYFRFPISQLLFTFLYLCFSISQLLFIGCYFCLSGNNFRFAGINLSLRGIQLCKSCIQLFFSCI